MFKSKDTDKKSSTTPTKRVAVKKVRATRTTKSSKPLDTLGLEIRPAENRSLNEYVESAYLNYSMYVILDRALPQLGDGLKPVQRRIIYAMSELGLRTGAKYKKSARTIGDVIGKFHPHGDSACYEAMVLMAQNFATRYCLVDGQGNWGSVDNAKSFAAMRYTEARLTPYAQLLLSELGRETTSWQANFDGTLEEPTMFPVRVPNVILNGATGIAVGMTTDIPSHNLSEIMDACLLLLKEPQLNKHLSSDGTSSAEQNRPAIERLMKKVPAPDFASGGVLISSTAEIAEVYLSGTGSLKLRCKYDISGKDIIVSELPSHTSTFRVIEQIQQQMQTKKLPMLVDIRDESDDENPVLLALETRKGTDRERVMSHLFATTDLEKNVRVNLNAISTGGKPRIWALNEMLYHWLEFRRACLIKKLENDLNKVKRRLHILEGLMIVYLNLDEVIRIIREEQEPKLKLIKKFKLSDEQAEAILETKLRHLAKLEEKKICGEEEDLTDKKYYLEKVLKSKDSITKLLKDEFSQIKKEYGDERRTLLQPESGKVVAETFKQEHLITKEPVTLVLSANGWIRLAKGHDLDPSELSYRDGDSFLYSWQGQNNQVAVFMDNHGRAYSVMAYTLPSARGLGEPLSSRLDLSDGAQVQAGLLAKEKEELFLISRDGYGFTIKADYLLAVNRKKGKQIMRIKNNLGLVQPVVVATDGNYRIAVLTKGERLLIITPDEIPQLTKGGKGVRVINIAYPKDEVKQVLIIRQEQQMAINYSKKEESIVLTEKNLKKYSANRATKGKIVNIKGADLPLQIKAINPQGQVEG